MSDALSDIIREDGMRVIQQLIDDVAALKSADGGRSKPIHMSDADAANDTIYYSTTLGKLVYKDPSGTVNALY